MNYLDNQNSKLISSLLDSHEDIKSDGSLFDDLNSLTKKYQQYNEKIYDQMHDPYIELVESKDDRIEELKIKNDELKQELIDLSILYNEKIEQIRIDHRKELHSQHKEYLKQLKKNNIQ